MAEATGTRSTRSSRRTALVVALAVITIAVLLACVIGGAYLLAVHEGSVSANRTIHSNQVSAAKAARAAAIAREGRSRALCGALKELAETRKAHKLHPIFEQVYRHSGCVTITGKATP